MKKFFKQINCTHDWEKHVSIYQLKKDDNKILWICKNCKKIISRNRWNPPIEK